MAKKRVHELAKQYDMPSAEVMTKLNAYGLKVKASASAVDEHEAERALTGKPPKKESNGKADDAASGRRRRRPAWASTSRRPRRPSSGSPSASSGSRRRRSAKDGGGRQAGRGRPRPRATSAAAADGAPRQRPTRSSLQGERAPGATGGVRRVVIDSQAARRGPGGPAAVPAVGPAARSAARHGAVDAAAAAATWSRPRRTSRR